MKAPNKIYLHLRGDQILHLGTDQIDLNTVQSGDLLADYILNWYDTVARVETSVTVQYSSESLDSGTTDYKDIKSLYE